MGDMTFLDLVRAVGELTHGKCCEECSPALHRSEAAQHLGVLLENPDLLRALAKRLPERARAVADPKSDE